MFPLTLSPAIRQEMTDGPGGVKSIVMHAKLRKSGAMRQTCQILLLSALLLGACAPLTIYHRAGVSVTRMERDTNACAVQALAQVPVNTQIRQTPPRYIPGRRICDGDGNCSISEGFYVPGHIYTVDVNKPLRRQTERQCMANRGYAPVSIPPCPAGVAQAVEPGRTTTLPPLRDGSCVIRNQDGSWQIVTVQK